MTIRLCSAERINATTFVNLRRKVHELLAFNQSKDLLISSPLGVGKSKCVDDMAIFLANHNYNILISVPTAELALQHKRYIESHGQRAFVLMSHRNIFGHQADPPKANRLADFNCPDYEDIDTCIKLGISASGVKKKFCHSCPFLLQGCPYPGQYTQAASMAERIVIIQHAHFSVRETLFTLLNEKNFHVLFIDESFIGALSQRIKPSILEVDAINAFPDFPWAQKLGGWLRNGGLPNGQLNPPERNLIQMKLFFDANLIPWKVPDYIRMFNAGIYCHSEVGLYSFSPLPEIPVRVLTDATPPIKMLQMVLDNPAIEVIGDNEVLDYRKYHPENEIIQVLDGSMSKTYIDAQNTFEAILEFIARKVTGEYNNEKCLITTYKSHVRKVLKYFAEHHPTVDIGTTDSSRVTINLMSVGTNRYLDYHIQFLIAGVYLNGRDYVKGEYELRAIQNYWNRRHLRKELSNPYPFYLFDGTNGNVAVDIAEDEVRKVTPLGVEKYPGFKTFPPVNYYHNLLYQHAIGKTQQAIRLRFAYNQSNKARKVFVFGNYNFKSLLITKTIVLDTLLKEDA